LLGIVQGAARNYGIEQRIKRWGQKLCIQLASVILQMQTWQYVIGNCK